MVAGEMEAAIQKVPMGYRFHPTDDEVLSYYLRRKNLGLREPECVIPEVDICRWEPRQLPGKFSESSIVEPKDPEWWFFCEQEPGRTPRRSTNGGYWKKTGRPRDLTSSYSKEVIGSKNFLTFFQGNSSYSIKTDWVMHEYHLRGNSLDGLLRGNRKNYVLCMIKCNSDKRANATPSFHEYEYERHEPTTIDSDQFLELEPDDGFIPEHLILAKMQSLEPLCRTSTNLPPMMMVEPQQHFSSLADPTATQLSFEGDSIELDSPFAASEDSDVTDFLNPVLIDQDDRFDGFEMQTDVFPSGVIQDVDDNMFETLMPHEQQAVIMENKQAQKVESIQGYVPIDEKKGIVEDDFPKPTASSLGLKSPEVKSKKEAPKITSYKPAEAKAQKHAPTKIKVEMLSACSSSTSIHKPREAVRRFEAQCHPLEINSTVALIGHERAARELKPVATRAKQMSSSTRKSSNDDPSMVYFWNLLVGVILFVAILYKFFDLLVGVILFLAILYKIFNL